MHIGKVHIHPAFQPAATKLVSDLNLNLDMAYGLAKRGKIYFGIDEYAAVAVKSLPSR
jgi:hypothetical protein